MRKMIRVEPVSIGLLCFVFLAILAIMGFMASYLRLVRKFGWPMLPAEVQRLQEGMATKNFRFDLAGCAPDRAEGDHRTYSKSYETKDGRWLLLVEYEKDDLIGFQVRLKHRHTWWLDGTFDHWIKEPKIITPSHAG